MHEVVERAIVGMPVPNRAADGPHVPVPDRTGPDRGSAVREVALPGARGRVVSVHRKAVYLRLDGALIALVAADVESGPLHLRIGPLPPAVRGERVSCDGSRITGRSWAVRCDVPDWRGALPARLTRRDDPAPPDDATDADDPLGRADQPDRLSRADQPGRVSPADQPNLPGRADPPGLISSAEQRDVRGPAIPPEVPVDPGRVDAAVRTGAVEELVELLGGAGPGLTPAGDDLLAGLVLAARAVWGPDAEPRLVAAVGTVATTEPAAAFLHWAARGQSLAPAHDVLTALADGDTAAAERAGRRLAAIGASSGRCLLAGLRIGLAQWPRLDTHSARAGPEPAL